MEAAQRHAAGLKTWMDMAQRDQRMPVVMPPMLDAADSYVGGLVRTEMTALGPDEYWRQYRQTWQIYNLAAALAEQNPGAGRPPQPPIEFSPQPPEIHNLIMNGGGSARYDNGIWVYQPPTGPTGPGIDTASGAPLVTPTTPTLPNAPPMMVMGHAVE
jgi:hypothetical protein